MILAKERFEAVSEGTTLTFFVRTTATSVFGKASKLTGWAEVAFDAEGDVSVETSPRMHVELQVEDLRSGNELKDREIWKMIDSKRFPKIAGDLQTLAKGSKRGFYNAAGQVTMAGLARRYEGTLSVQRFGDGVILDGYLEVDVRDFGLKEKQLLTLKVEPVVKVHLHLVTKKAS